MRKHVREAKHDLSVRAKRASRELNRSAKERKAVFEHQLEEAISDLSVKADDLIATLEHKLAELKAKNANLQKGHPPAGSK